VSLSNLQLGYNPATLAYRVKGKISCITMPEHGYTSRLKRQHIISQSACHTFYCNRVTCKVNWGYGYITMPHFISDINEVSSIVHYQVCGQCVAEQVYMYISLYSRFSSHLFDTYI